MIRLDRRLWNRLFSGQRLQGLWLLFALLLLSRIVGQLGGWVDDPSLPLWDGLLVLLALVALMAPGWFAHAEADDTGIRWRYLRTHSYRWDEIDELQLEAVGVGIAAVRRTISVRVDGRRHRITPAASGGAGRVRFGRELAAAATARGIPVDARWRRRVALDPGTR